MRYIATYLLKNVQMSSVMLQYYKAILWCKSEDFKTIMPWHEQW